MKTLKDYRRKIVIRGEADGLRVAGEIFSPSNEGRVPPIKQKGREFTPGPYAVVRIEDGGEELFVVAHKGAIPGEPELWSLGVACPKAASLPRWHIRRISPEGSSTVEMHIVLSMGSTVEVLG